MIARPYDMIAYSPAVNSAAMPTEIRFCAESTSELFPGRRCWGVLLRPRHGQDGVPRLRQLLRPHDADRVAGRRLHEHVDAFDQPVRTKLDLASGQQRVLHH